MKPFQNHPFEMMRSLWGKRVRCTRCGFSFTWGEDDVEYCEHLHGLQPLEWVAAGLVAPERQRCAG
jgi:hypothetical protein